LIEVLSKSTADYDRGEKREHYQQIETLREYVLIEQDHHEVEVFVRLADQSWHHATYRSGATVELPSLGVSFTVAELYDIAGVPA
jgi:Uma2 family endonuclease